MQELDEYLEHTSLEGVLSAPSGLAGDAPPADSRPKAQRRESSWGLRWFMRKHPDRGAGNREAKADVTWLGELQCVGREIEHSQTWAAYDAELCHILGIEGGADAVFVRLALHAYIAPCQNAAACPAHSLTRASSLEARAKQRCRRATGCSGLRHCPGPGVLRRGLF
jgi:hypothetical protein